MRSHLLALAAVSLMMVNLAKAQPWLQLPVQDIPKLEQLWPQDRDSQLVDWLMSDPVQQHQGHIAFESLVPYLLLLNQPELKQSWQQSFTASDQQWQGQPMRLAYQDDDAAILMAWHELDDRALLWFSLSTDSPSLRNSRLEQAVSWSNQADFSSYLDWTVPLGLMSGQRKSGQLASDWQVLTQGGWRMSAPDWLQPECAADWLALIPGNAVSWHWHSEKSLQLDVPLTQRQLAFWQSLQAPAAVLPTNQEFVQINLRLLPLLRFYQQQWAGWTQLDVSCAQGQQFQQLLQDWQPLTLVLLANSLPGLQAVALWHESGSNSHQSFNAALLSNRPQAILPSLAAALGITQVPKLGEERQVAVAGMGRPWLVHQEGAVLLAQQPLQLALQSGALVSAGFSQARRWCLQANCVDWPERDAQWPVRQLQLDLVGQNLRLQVDF